MKIAYLLDEDLNSSAGVARKVSSQIEIWRTNGHHAEVIGMRIPRLDSSEDGKRVAKGLEKIRSHFRNAADTLDRLTNFKPDVIYTRYIKYAPRFARQLQEIAPYVIEVNTNDVTEFSLKNRWHGIYNKYTRHIFFQMASGLVCVTSELARDPVFSQFHLPTVVIGNGFAFSSVSPEHVGREGNDTRRLIFVGSGEMPWHGVDKVLSLSKALPEFEFHIVGPSPTEFSSSDVASENLVWHGPLSESAVDELIQVSDVGISTLALHRNRMNEACPLKSRHYLARGLPIIVGYSDPDLENFGPWVLQLPNVEDNVRDSVELIRQFIISTEAFDRSVIRDVAKSRLDYTAKEQIRLKFLHSIAAERRAFLPTQVRYTR